MSLEKVTTYFVPSGIVSETEEALRRAGERGYELFVLWSGVVDGTAFNVETHHVPKQTSYQLTSGLCVKVDGDELHRLNVWLFEAGQSLGVQVHAHPRRAYHSATDDAYPIVATVGGLSVVAPNFCRKRLLSRGTAVYRLRGGRWAPESLKLIKVI